jgi:hypothetical protein
VLVLVLRVGALDGPQTVPRVGRDREHDDEPPLAETETKEGRHQEDSDE